MISKAEHTRRQFLGAVAGLGAAAAVPGATGRALAATDVYRVNLLELGIPPVDYRTQWPTGTNITVKVWDASFRKAHELLNANGGGELVVPGNSVPYYLRDHQVFDLPTVTVRLEAGSEVLMVGPKNPYLGCPLGFFGGLGDGVPPRVQRPFAAVAGPGKVGFPAAQLEYYERGNALGFSYIKQVIVDGVHVPFAPRFAMTAQYGCSDVWFRNSTIGRTGTPEEIKLGGHAVLNVSGGTFVNGQVNPNGLRTKVRITNNTIGGGHRVMYLEHCGQVDVLNNRFGPMGTTGLTIADCHGAYVYQNRFDQCSRGAWGGSDVMEFADVSTVWVSYNQVLNNTHRHCVRSWDIAGGLIQGRVSSRYNHYFRGRSPVFAGSPFWDSQFDTFH